ncbi:MAG: glycosyltransferase family 2 protein [Candidatus Saganbacteria bacterium]|nr:glycosyltransferase family 2 protein [Candidatus Saganbacteria bacterium]
MEISCFFPMYNEETNVKSVVCAALAVLSKSFKDFEIIIVNDGSTDRTARVVEDLNKLDGRIRLVSHEKNLGYGAALRTGFKVCKAELIFQTDGDNQYDLDELENFLPFVAKYDFIIGYRIKRRDPFYRSLEAAWYRFLLRRLFRLELKDANCAFKLFKKSIIDQLDLRSSGAIINGEIFVKARKLGYDRIKEVGVSHYPRKTGKQTGARPKVLWEALTSILRLWAQERQTAVRP